MARHSYRQCCSLFMKIGSVPRPVIEFSATLSPMMHHIWLTVVIYVGHMVASADADKSLEEKGRLQLQRVQQLADQPRYGECWSRALERIHTRCREFTEETQSKIALAFTHCHLSRSVTEMMCQC